MALFFDECFEAFEGFSDTDGSSTPITPTSASSSTSTGSRFEFPTVTQILQYEEHHEEDKVRKKRSASTLYQERERRRHSNVNAAFECLRTLLPVYPINKKLKKREILRRSIKYINLLRATLHNMPDDDVQEHRAPGALTNDTDYRVAIEELDTNPIILIDDHNQDQVTMARCPLSVHETAHRLPSPPDYSHLAQYPYQPVAYQQEPTAAIQTDELDIWSRPILLTDDDLLHLLS